MSNDFRKSSFSVHGDCVEVTFADGWIGVRDSKSPDGPVLWFTPAEWDAFLCGVITGEFGAGHRAVRWLGAVARVVLGVVL